MNPTGEDRGILKQRQLYERKPRAPFIQREFGFYCLEEWYTQGLPRDVPLERFFGFDPPGSYDLWGVGWTEAQFCPWFEEKVLEDRGEHELVRDGAGRQVLYFKNRRSGFMPEYLGHPVKDRASWDENCKWRLDPKTPQRYANLDETMRKALDAQRKGMMISQRVVGGYMYLRSLFGPADIMYAVCEDPELIHECMKTWLALADGVIGEHQKYVGIDELFLAEDICYNNGLLISPDMIRGFLLPYYQQLIEGIKRRQSASGRHLYIQIDTDGFAPAVIDLYREIGMEVMSPFEVAAGCDVVEIGKKYPDLVMSGGIDKRVLAESREAIDRHVDRIFPVMFERGGYTPTCDHGVPAEVSLENYLHYRARCREYGG
jgi:hypothetical protein